MLLWLKEQMRKILLGRIDKWHNEMYVDPEDDPQDDVNDFFADSYVDHVRNDEEKIRKILREEQELRDEETDPLMKLFLPPLGHRWVYKNKDE